MVAAAILLANQLTSNSPYPGLSEDHGFFLSLAMDTLTERFLNERVDPEDVLCMSNKMGCTALRRPSLHVTIPLSHDPGHNTFQ